MGDIKGDTRSLDYSSFRVLGTELGECNWCLGCGLKLSEA